jgi:PmbA protein
MHEIYCLGTESASLSFSGGELKTKESDSSSGYGVRVLEKNKLGFAYCQKEEDIEKAKADAARMSRFSVESKLSFAPQSGYEKMDIFDPALDLQDSAALRSFLDEAREGAESKGGHARVMLDAGRMKVKIDNSAGLHAEYVKTAFSVYAECMHDDGFGMAYVASHRPQSVRDIGLKAAQMASDMRGAKKPESGTYTVVMEPDALMSVLDTLIPSFSGDWKRRGITKLTAGEKKFSDFFSLSEDGLAQASDCRPFDDEGTPSKKKFLVRDGVVESFLYDRETAALAGVDESGACSRDGYDRPPTIHTSNIVISPGTWNDLNELDKHIELHYAHGSHTANPTSGDIGLEASAAFLVSKGERKPLKGFMLSGNVFDMFADIEGIEKKQETNGSLIAPRIAFRNLRVVS